MEQFGEKRARMLAHTVKHWRLMKIILKSEIGMRKERGIPILEYFSK